MLDNILMHTDVYKMGHPVMYPPDLTKLCSYLIARKGDKYPQTVFFGNQYILKEWLSRFPTHENVNHFMRRKRHILGLQQSEAIAAKLHALVDLDYWPLKIQSVREGTIVPAGNMLATFENTHPDFPWIVGFLESLFLKVWNTCTVATFALKYKSIAEQYAESTCDNNFHVPYQVHDFGYRGVSSEETALRSGMSHLVIFNGSDTLPAIDGLFDYYGLEDDSPIGVSVPATEHSVVCSYGQTHEDESFDRVMSQYPQGILSMVSDTYNLWNIVTKYAASRHDVIEARDGKIVFRPDGGYPPYIVAGDPAALSNTVERKGVVELLWDEFGGTINEKGFKVLNPHVGVIFGEGMTPQRFNETCLLLAAKGFASSNFVIGVGGLLLQGHNRDDMGFAIKATWEVRNGEVINLVKNPVTSPNKKSHEGPLRLEKTERGYETHTRTLDEPSGLETIWEDGVLLIDDTLEEIRARVFAKENACITI